ncbi:MAG: elements of external origin [Gammaproteobacteria bacterium]|nr:elements of external origin [Gammaproteobacteria bacterium]
MGVSLRAYAKHRGVSDTAVRKAIKSGRTQTEADGTIDDDKVGRQWARNTDTAQQRKTPSTAKPVSKAALEAVDATLKEQGGPASGTTYMQAHTANEVLKAQTNRVKLQQLKQTLVDHAQAIAQVFKLARYERDAWLNWPARVSAQMAAELEVYPHTLHVSLEAAVREHLQALGELQPQVD